MHSCNSSFQNESFNTTTSTRKLTDSPASSSSDTGTSVSGSDSDDDDADDDDDDDDDDEEVVLKPPRRVPVVASSSSDADSQSAKPTTLTTNTSTTDGRRSKSPLSSSVRKAAALQSDSEPSATPRHQPQNNRESIRKRATRRQLTVERIVGAVNDAGKVDFVVKWKGLERFERVPMNDMKELFPIQVLDFMYPRIKWLNQK
jgi:hypothetical protein